MKRASLVAFLGPSLPATEARALVPSATLLPPARRGDVWRALSLRPRAIALIDGLFEASPSVWHREILEALEAGVGVFGGASMGALRAVELGAFGMVGVGRIYRWFKDGTLIDDAEVALLHAGATHGHRPVTVPLVNVRWAAQQASRSGVLTRGEARALVRAAADIFYQERSWPSILARLGTRWPAVVRFQAYMARGLPDLKAEDARAVLAAAAGFARTAPKSPLAPLRWRPPSQLIQRKLGVLASGPPERALLAALARSLGLRVDARALWKAAKEVSKERGCRNRAEVLRWAEELALARLAVEHGKRLLPGVAR